MPSAIACGKYASRVRGDRRLGDHARIAAARRELGAVRVAERERVEVDRVLGEALLRGVRLVEVAEEAGGAAAPDRRRRAAHQEANLAPTNLIVGSAALRRDLVVAVLPFAPVVPLLVALARVVVGAVLGVRDVIVGVDQAGRDHAVGAGHRRRAGRHRGAHAADAGDVAGRVDEDAAAAINLGRRQHRAEEEFVAVARRDRTRAARDGLEVLTRHLVRRLGAVVLAPVAGDLVAVVALLTGVDVAVAADADDLLLLALRRAAVAVLGVPVVALLAGVLVAVAALAARLVLDLTGRRAAVAAHGVAVVALLTRVDVAVAALGRDHLDLAGARATVAVHGVPVVALLAHVDVPVTTSAGGVGVAAATALRRAEQTNDQEPEPRQANLASHDAAHPVSRKRRRGRAHLRPTRARTLRENRPPEEALPGVHRVNA